VTIISKDDKTKHSTELSVGLPIAAKKPTYATGRRWTMADDDFFTFPPPHHITPASSSNSTALPEHPMDSGEKKRIPNLSYMSSKSPPTNEWPQEAHVMLPLTRPLMKTFPIHLSPEQVPHEFAPIRPPPKPPDYCHQKQNMPQQYRGVP